MSETVKQTIENGKLKAEGLVHNFNAGPAILPKEVYEEAARAVMDYNGSGLSILEIGHRPALGLLLEQREAIFDLPLQQREPLVGGLDALARFLVVEKRRVRRVGGREQREAHEDRAVR